MKHKLNIPALLEALQKIADQRSLTYLRNEPIAVYQELLGGYKIAPYDARIALAVLLTPKMRKIGTASFKAGNLASYFASECGFRDELSKEAADLFGSFLSKDSVEKWNGRNFEGLKKFCSSSWEFDLEADSTWHANGGHIDCFLAAHAKISVADAGIVEREMAGLLEKTPYMTAEEIRDHYQDLLQKELALDFDEYCTAEEYYGPDAEDYPGNGEEVVDMFCRKHGLLATDVDFDCGQTDFE